MTKSFQFLGKLKKYKNFKKSFLKKRTFNSSQSEVKLFLNFAFPTLLLVSLPFQPCLTSSNLRKI